MFTQLLLKYSKPSSTALSVVPISHLFSRSLYPSFPPLFALHLSHSLPLSLFPFFICSFSLLTPFLLPPPSLSFHLPFPLFPSLPLPFPLTFTSLLWLPCSHYWWRLRWSRLLTGWLARQLLRRSRLLASWLLTNSRGWLTLWLTDSWLT